MKLEPIKFWKKIYLHKYHNIKSDFKTILKKLFVNGLFKVTKHQGI